MWARDTGIIASLLRDIQYRDSLLILQLVYQCVNKGQTNKILNTAVIQTSILNIYRQKCFRHTIHIYVAIHPKRGLNFRVDSVTGKTTIIDLFSEWYPLISVLFWKGIRGFQFSVFVLSFSLFQICLVSFDYANLVSHMGFLHWTHARNG